MNEKLLSPRNDYVFLSIFSKEENKAILISLLSSIITEKIVDLEFLSPDMGKDEFTDMGSALHVCVKTDQGVSVDIVVQIAYHSEYVSRVMFHWARLFSSQFSRGTRFQTLKKIISITFFDDYADFCPHFQSIYHLREVLNEPNHLLTDLAEFHFIDMQWAGELPIEELTDSPFMWTAFISSDNPELLEALAARDPCIKKAYIELQQLSQNKETRMIAEAREKLLVDQAIREGTAREEGEKKGKEEGRREGKKEGEKKGILETSKLFLAAGMDIKEVCRITGLCESDLLH